VNHTRDFVRYSDGLEHVALLGLRLRFPFDAGGTTDVPAEEGRVAQQLVSYQPQAAVRRDVATGDETEHSGFTSRGAIQIGRTVLPDIRGYFEVSAEVKHRWTGTREGARQARRVDTEGLAGPGIRLTGGPDTADRRCGRPPHRMGPGHPRAGVKVV